MAISCPGRLAATALPKPIAARIPDSPPTGRFEWNDLWLFSARVPIPQHRKSTGEARKPDED